MTSRRPVALVTGAASGIGRATALELARRGYDLVPVDVNAEALEQATSELRHAGAAVSPQARDLAKKSEVQACAEQALADAGRVDLLYNNAGVLYMGHAREMTLEDWEWIIDVNLWAPIRLTHALLPHMLERGNGTIACTASTAGLVPMPHLVAYTLTKHALVGMCQSLALEVEPEGVSVCVVAPGQITTGLVKGGRFDGTSRAAGALEMLGSGAGYPLDKAAREIADGLIAKKSTVLVGREVAPLWWIKRVSPRLSHRLGKLLFAELEKRTGAPGMSGG